MSSEKILTFNAGRADYDEATKTVKPLAGPGKVIVNRDPDESYLYFSWEPRDKFEPPEDFPQFETYALIPGDARWSHVKQCTSGRVFALKFLSSDKKEFFWMQSRTDAKDKKLGSLSTEDKSIIESFETLLSEDNMNADEEGDEEEQFDPTSPSGDASGSHVSQPNDLTALLRSVTTPNPQSSSKTTIPILNLSDALPIQRLLEHINSLSDSELEPLFDTFPEEIPRTRADLIHVIESPQFVQGMDSFSNVLLQGGLGSIVANELGYPYTGEGVEGFLTGIRKKTDSEKKSEQENHDEMDIE